MECPICLEELANGTDKWLPVCRKHIVCESCHVASGSDRCPVCRAEPEMIPIDAAPVPVPVPAPRRLRLSRRESGVRILSGYNVFLRHYSKRFPDTRHIFREGVACWKNLAEHGLLVYETAAARINDGVITIEEVLEIELPV